MAKSRKTSGVGESGARYKKQKNRARRPASASVSPPGRGAPSGVGKFGALRAEIRAGIVALDSGKFSDVSDRDLDGHIDRLGTPARPRGR